MFNILIFFFALSGVFAWGFAFFVIYKIWIEQ